MSGDAVDRGCSKDGKDDGDDKDDGSCTTTLASVKLAGVIGRTSVDGICGDDGNGDSESPVINVLFEEELIISASYSSFTQPKAAATHKFLRSLPEYSGVSAASC